MKGIIGAIAGDVIGSAYEFNPTRDYTFELFTPVTTFTDDTVLTMANAIWLLEDEKHQPETLVNIMLDLCRRYPDRGYGGRFAQWIHSDDPQPYDSFGNGSAMRVSPVGYYARTLDEALELAKVKSATILRRPSVTTCRVHSKRSVPPLPLTRLVNALSPRPSSASLREKTMRTLSAWL